jgi:hypothetical protein
MNPGESLKPGNHSFPCQMAGANDYKLGKTGCKGLDRLE